MTTYGACHAVVTSHQPTGVAVVPAVQRHGGHRTLGGRSLTNPTTTLASHQGRSRPRDRAAGAHDPVDLDLTLVALSDEHFCGMPVNVLLAMTPPSALGENALISTRATAPRSSAAGGLHA